MRISQGVPGWPFQWVSARGRYQGKAESLVLIHYTVEPGRKTLFLTARDKKRRVWSTVLTLGDGTLLEKFERAVAGMLNSPLRELGGLSLDAEESAAPSVPVLSHYEEKGSGNGDLRGAVVERPPLRARARARAAAQ